MEVGLAVGGWFAGAAISKLINEFVEGCKAYKKKLGLEDELARLEDGLPKIQVVMEDVDLGLVRELANKPLVKWLWQLRDVVDQADDVMDEMEYYLVKKKVQSENKVSILKKFIDDKGDNKLILKKLKETVKEMDKVFSDFEKLYSVVHNLVKRQKEMVESAITSRLTDSVLNVGNQVYGRDKEKKEIVSKLLNPECKIKGAKFSVLPIIGVGGVGKTTLAQLVYNDPEVKKRFELRMWVCVSNHFDVDLLRKKLYESAFHQSANFVNQDLIASKLSEELKFKRFLVIFDDVWNDNNKLEWEKLTAPLKSENNIGSMILLTTRTTEVARLPGPNVLDPVFLVGLNETDTWGIFVENAFGREDPGNHSELVRIGRDIVKKLEGSPLAAKTVGRILGSYLNVIHWTSILQNELWSIEQQRHEIMPALRLTYQYLPSHLKPCFSFCSIFPQDHIFVKDDLINMWVALGLVPRNFNGAKRPEDVGSEYFEEMLNRLIFSPANLRNTVYTDFNITDKQFLGGYIMHDLMHDLSAFVSQGECFRSNTDRSVDYIPPTVRHLYIRVGAHFELGNLDLKNVRTLILYFDDFDQRELDYSAVNDMVEKAKNLRVLKLYALILNKFPERVCDLLHLRYLSLSSFKIDEFPSSMSKLYLLETMVCVGFVFEKPSQAAGLAKLINIRHLIVSEQFVETISCFGTLTSLQELSCRVGKKGGFKIRDLKDMRELRHLSISNVDDIGSGDEAKEANMESKVSLSKLTLEWETNKWDKKVVKHLEPHCDLKELIMRKYGGGRLPDWLETKAFTKLEVLTLGELTVEEMPSLEKMQCLKELTVDDCPNLWSLPSLPVTLKKLKLKRLILFFLPNFLKGQSDASGKLPSLVCLEISECQKLESLDVGLLQECEQLSALEELIITDCRELKDMSKVDFSKLNSLKRLDISDCPKIKQMDVDRVSLPTTLQFVRFNSYVKDGQAIMRNEETFQKLCLQPAPRFQTEEAKLVIFDLSGSISNLESELSTMNISAFRWPPIQLTETLQNLVFLSIDGNPSAHEYRSEKLPDPLNQLFEIVCGEKDTSLNMEDLSKMPEKEQFYLATQHIKSFRSLKRLLVGLCSKSLVIPHFPDTLKELRLSNLGLAVLPDIFQYKSSNSSSSLSLLKLEISDCPNLVDLNIGLLKIPEQFAALEELTIQRCGKLQHLPEGDFSTFLSLKKLVISDCPKILHMPRLPSTVQFICIEGDQIDLRDFSLKFPHLLKTEEAKLVVFVSNGSVCESELSVLKERNYVGDWSLQCLKTIPSNLEYVSIDGNPPLDEYCSEKLPPKVNELLEIIHKGDVTSYLDSYLTSNMEDLSKMPEQEEFYLALPHNQWMHLKRLSIGLCSRSCVMPLLPRSLKELRLSNLGLADLPCMWSLPFLVQLEISNFPNLLSLATMMLEWPQNFEKLEELTIRYCKKLRYLPEGGFSKFSSLERLDIYVCPSLELSFMHVVSLPSKLQFVRIESYVEDIQANRNKDNFQELSLQYDPTLRTEEATLFIFDDFGPLFKSQFIVLQMRNYVHRWSPYDEVKFPRFMNISELEYLSIDGDPSLEEYRSEIKEVSQLLSIIYEENITSCPDLYFHADNIGLSEMPEQFYFEIQGNWACRLKRLSIGLRSKSCAMPYFPGSLKELRLSNLGLADLPYMRSRFLVQLEITNFPNLVSLATGMLKWPQEFASLEELTVQHCEELRYLPIGGFSKFRSLERLDIRNCPSIHNDVVPDSFLPYALRVLHIESCGNLDEILPEALKNVYYLSSLELFDCQNITNLPRKEVFSRWQTLEKLALVNCPKLTSLESLVGLRFIKQLTIRACPKLVSSTPTIPLLSTFKATILSILGKSDSAQQPSTNPSSSTGANEKPLFSVDELEIDDRLLLGIEPIRSYTADTKINIKNR